MLEKRNVNQRMAFLLLLIVNVLFFVYWRFATDDRATIVSQIQNLQINPTKIRVIGIANRGPGGQTPKAACLEWGPFPATDLPNIDAALAGLNLKQPAMQRTVGELAGVKRIAFFVREPDQAIVARIADLRRSFPETSIKAGPCPS